MFNAHFAKHAQFIFISQEDTSMKADEDAAAADDAEAGEKIDSDEQEA